MSSTVGETTPRTVRRLVTRRGGLTGCALLVLLGLGGVAGGCAAPASSRAARQRDVAAVARPLLEMRPDANWTECYNRLVELGPASVEYLISRPIMQRTAAPDDLRVTLHISLLRLLASPATAPTLTVNCFETTLDVLHFNPKVRGRALGEVRIPTARTPVAWHDLYPSDFDHLLACQIDVEADRQAMLDWWRTRRGGFDSALTRRRLQPQIEHLWPVLSRRYADVWTYEARPAVLLCSSPPGRAALFRGPTCDYNLVRAVCIWLGMSELPPARDTLVELVAHPSEVVAYNARFALSYSRDARIREVLERYKEPGVPPAATGLHTSAAVTPWQSTAPRWMLPSHSSCGEQGSAAHEVAQAHIRQCVDHRDGDVHGRAVWRT